MILAVSFQVSFSPKPVALMINQLESQLLVESAAFVSLLILTVNIALKVIVAVLKKRAGKGFGWPCCGEVTSHCYLF